MKTCAKCEVDKPVSDFNKSSKSKDGLHSYCRSCHKNHYSVNKTRHIANVKKVKAAYQESMVQWKFDYLKSVGCEVCGEKNPIMLDFDHLDPNDKSYTISEMIRFGHSLENIKIEVAKCRVLCANHHRLRTAEQMGWKSFMLLNTLRAGCAS